MSIEKLKYKDKPIYMEALVKGVYDAGVELELKGRLGTLKVPMRMIISDDNIEIGQTVGFMMTYPETIGE